MKVFCCGAYELPWRVIHSLSGRMSHLKARLKLTPETVCVLNDTSDIGLRPTLFQRDLLV
jgi:hypothetical protein